MRPYSVYSGLLPTFIFAGILTISDATASECTASSPKLKRFEYHRIVMGVPFKLTLYAETIAVANKTQTAVYKRLRELNIIFSDYDRDSELSQLCINARPGIKTQISSELFDIFEKSLKLSQESKGAFDISVGPYVKMWRRAKRKKIMPTDEMLNIAREKVGYNLIQLDINSKTVQLLREGMQLDLGGIAKGYACDEVINICRNNGIKSVLIDAGGDIVVGDAPPGTSGWRIGIASLDQPEQKPNQYLILNNSAVATSGDAYQFVEFNGIRYSHLVNPQTGIGLTRRFSVTVIAKNGTQADSLASAVSVLGPQKGIQLINSKKGCETLISELINGELKIEFSENFGQYLQKTK